MSGRECGLRTLHDAHAVRETRKYKLVQQSTRPSKLTWVPRTAVRTEVVAGYALDQFLQDFLVTRLLALAEGSGHSQGWRRRGCVLTTESSACKSIKLWRCSASSGFCLMTCLVRLSWFGAARNQALRLPHEIQIAQTTQTLQRATGEGLGAETKYYGSTLP